MWSNRRLGLVFALAAMCGCARVSSALDDNLGNGGNGDVDLATPGDAPDLGDDTTPALDMATAAMPDLRQPTAPLDMAVARDLATPPDLAMPPDLATPPDLAKPADMVVVASCHLVVNELQTETTQQATEEFVEIYNPCASAVTVDGWKLGYRSATNVNGATSSDNSTLYTFAGSLASGAYFVLGGAKFLGTKQGALASGLATSGSVALRDGSGAIVDSLAYGSVAAGNAFIETAAAPLPPSLSSPGGSIERMPNGSDTNDNSHDFSTTTQATPGAVNH
jgi:hypothetical protein